MKKCLSVLFLVSWSFSGTALGGLILVDTTTRNGGFESYTTDQGDGIGRFTSMQYWFNYGGGSETATDGRSTNPVYAGTYSAIVSAASVPSINTGHAITAADQYTLAFANRSNSTTAYDIRWVLYYYTNEGQGGFDETSDTTGTTLLSGTLTVPTVAWNVSTVASDAGFSNPGALGKTLYMRFERVSGAGFPRVDDVTLSVIPEPGTLGLVLAFGVAAVIRRHRIG